MKKSLCLSFVIASMLILFCFAKCKKQNTPLTENTPITITLHNKPLDTIRSYIQGKWKLHYTKGGFCGTCVWTVKFNPYMIVNNNRIILGNDSAGIVLDTTIYWKRAKDIFHDSTYLLTYYYPPRAGNFPISYIVDGIYNDTLRLSDDAYEPFYYYYTH